MKKSFYILILISIVLATGCIGQQQYAKTLEKDGVEYQFSDNIYDSMKIPVYDEDFILDRIRFGPEKITVVFNGSSLEDNAYFATVGFNVAHKLANFFTYSQGRFVNITALDINNNVTQIPGSIIYMKGPNTGAEGNSVSLSNLTVGNNTYSIVVMQGTTYQNLSQAGDRLILLVLDFRS